MGRLRGARAADGRGRLGEEDQEGKLTDSCFGLIFKASEVLIIKGADEDGAGSFNLGGVEVAEPEQEADEACGGEGGFGGQFH